MKLIKSAPRLPKVDTALMYGYNHCGL
jgi:hypothetical protein